MYNIYNIYIYYNHSVIIAVTMSKYCIVRNMNEILKLKYFYLNIHKLYRKYIQYIQIFLKIKKIIVSIIIHF